ncbi:MAG: ROK family protein [Chloroflexota bacterium]|nr:ROK family protein [Chloroflexota bacterium]
MNIIGVDVGGTKILSVRADEKGNIQARELCATEADRGLDYVVGLIAGSIEKLAGGETIEAVGLGVPGPLDPVKGIVYDPPNLPGWDDVPLVSLLRKKLDTLSDVPVVLVNDANAAALAEYHFGAGTRYKGELPLKHLVYLTISTGIGGGVITDGKLLVGSTGMAAELGHIVIDAGGPRCGCGNLGCLEACAAGPALAREGYLIVKSRRPTKMAQMVNGVAEDVTAEIVVKAARQGDHEAMMLMEREGMLVGVGVVNCIHAFNPQLIVLGGGVTNAKELLFDRVRATVEDRIMPAYKGTYQIVPAALGGDVGALGTVAAALVEVQSKAQGA